MSRLGFEVTIPLLEKEKTFRVLALWLARHLLSQIPSPRIYTPRSSLPPLYPRALGHNLTGGRLNRCWFRQHIRSWLQTIRVP
jgi:hypothetical protein